MPEAESFQELIRRVRAGDADAAAELVRRYEPAIRRAARVRLVDPRLRRMFDSQDICQSVFASFFARAASGQYELDKPQQLLNLLVAMGCRKLADHVRHEAAERRDYRRRRAGGRLREQFVGATENPSQDAAAHELLGEMWKRLSPEEQELAEQRVQDRGWNEIAADKGRTPDALRKKLVRALVRVAQQLGLDGFHHE